MKKFLAFLMAALMLLSVAVAEAIPSPSAEVGIVDVPSKTPSFGGTATPNLFYLREDPDAVKMAEQVLDTIEAATNPIEVFSPVAQTVVLEALSAKNEDVKLAANPVVVGVNVEVAKTVTGDQTLMLSNVPVGSKFVVVLDMRIGNTVSEIVLTDVDADPATLQVYAKVDKETLDMWCLSDMVAVTVLTVE